MRRAGTVLALVLVAPAAVAAGVLAISWAPAC